MIRVPAPRRRDRRRDRRRHDPHHRAALATTMLLAPLTLLAAAAPAEAVSALHGTADSASAATAAAPERPRDPFVYRCVLDGNARMVVVSLAEDLAVAYDARTCGLALAWNGQVTFQGAVYDTTHGPQPVHTGPPRLVAGDGPAWMLQPAGGEPVPATVRWLGYRVEDGAAHLRYELSAPGLAAVTITESPEVRRDEDGAPILERRLRREGGGDVGVLLAGPLVAGADDVAAAIGTDGRPPRRGADGRLHVPLSPGRVTTVTIADLGPGT